MQVQSLDIPDLKIIMPKRFGDERGYFAETYHRRDLAAQGVDVKFVQDNESLSQHSGTVRGLHFQTPPHAQAKLVRVIRGAIFDVAVDLRIGSPTFGHHRAVTLNAEDGTQFYVPVGFAHGFCTLEPNTQVIYKVSDYYAPESDAGVLWHDPALNIPWPVTPEEATVSDKDRRHPTWATFRSPFTDT